MTGVIADFVLPAMASLLPPALDTPESRAMLMAIGFQESRFLYRRQLHDGPARGFWQFEVGGVDAVLTHNRTHLIIAQALHALSYDHTLDAAAFHQALEHNDVLAACFARCLLWATLLPVPLRGDAVTGWQLYVEAWRPGKPQPDTWPQNFGDAWATFQSPTLRA